MLDRAFGVEGEAIWMGALEDEDVVDVPCKPEDNVPVIRGERTEAEGVEAGLTGVDREVVGTAALETEIGLGPFVAEAELAAGLADPDGRASFCLVGTSFFVETLG